MPTFSSPRPPGRTLLLLATVVTWTVAAAIAAFWVLHWPKPEHGTVVSEAVSSKQTSTDLHAPLSRALGQSASVPSTPALQANSAYKLMGVIASPSGQGSALIAVNGQPPKAYRVGQTVQDGWTLVSLTARQARLAASGTEVLLDLPAADKP